MLPSPFDQIPEISQRTRHLGAGDLAFRQGDKTRGLYFVIFGKIELWRYTKAGEGVLIHRANTGETFAEASIFSDEYHCDAASVIESQLVELDRWAILDKIRDEPEFALTITRRFAVQNQMYRRKLELLAIKSAQSRIFAAISEGYLTQNIKSFASDIGLSHEVVYRGLAELVDKGALVKTGRGKYRKCATPD